MKLKRSILAIIGICQYNHLSSTCRASETTPIDDFLSKFETGDSPDIPKVTLDMYNVVDLIRYTSIVYDNQEHQANVYKNELSELKTGLLDEINEFKTTMNTNQNRLNSEVKDMKKTLEGQAKTILNQSAKIAEQKIEIKNLKDQIAINAVDASRQNSSIAERVQKIESTFKSEIKNQGKILLNTINNIKKIITTERSDFYKKLTERDAINTEQNEIISGFKTTLNVFEKKFNTTVNDIISEQAEAIGDLQKDVEDNSLGKLSKYDMSKNSTFNSPPLPKKIYFCTRYPTLLQSCKFRRRRKIFLHMIPYLCVFYPPSQKK